MAERELSNPPDMRMLFARAGVGAIPGASRLPFVGVPFLELLNAGMSAD